MASYIVYIYRSLTTTAGRSRNFCRQKKHNLTTVLGTCIQVAFIGYLHGRLGIKRDGITEFEQVILVGMAR